MTGRQLHRTATAVLSLAMVAIGIVLAVEALLGDEGVISARLLLGVLFAAAGAGRLYIDIRRFRGV
jgi:hypothetical protein